MGELSLSLVKETQYMDGYQIGLFADRLARNRGTGVGAYVEGLAAGFSDLPQGCFSFRLLSLPEREVPSPSRYSHLPISQLQLPRQFTRLAWALCGRPRIDADKGSFDLLHVLVPVGPVPTRLPLVVTIHDLMPLKFPHLFDRHSRFFFRLAMGQARREAAHIIAVSERTRQDIIEILDVAPERVTTVHLGAPTDIGTISDQERAEVLIRYGLAEVQYVLFVGELAARKNPIRLAEAFAQIATELPMTRLVYVGSPGIGYDDLRMKINKLKIDSRVELLGHVPRKDVLSLHAGATAFVLPSRYEGFGIPVIEAMLSDTPVIVSDAGALPEVVGNAGIVVPGADAAGLAAAIRRVLTDSQLRDSLVCHGRHRARTFSWDLASRRTVDVYQEVLKRKTPDKHVPR